MNKKLTLPISLLACLVLLVGCGGGKKESSSPTESEPDSSEVPPAPVEDKGLEIFTSLDNAAFVNFGELGDSYAVAKEIENSGKGFDSEYVSDAYTRALMVNESTSYDFESESFTNTHYESGINRYDEDIYDVRNFYRVSYNVGIGNFLAQYSDIKMVSVKKDDTSYLKLYNKISGDDPIITWEIDERDYASSTFSSMYSSLDKDVYGCYYTKIGNYHYFVYIYMENEPYSFTDYTGNDRSTFIRRTMQDVYKFDSEYNFLGYYDYSEITVEHNVFSGQLLEAPMIVARQISSLNLSYDENPYPDKKGLLASIPTYNILSVDASYKIGAVTFNSQGKISALPDYPADYSLVDTWVYQDDDHYALAFSFYPGSDAALELNTLSLEYSVLQGEEKGNTTTFTLTLNDKVFVEKVAAAINATYQVYNDTNYLILEANRGYGFKIIFPKFEEPNANNVQIVPYNIGMILVP